MTGEIIVEEVSTGNLLYFRQVTLEKVENCPDDQDIIRFRSTVPLEKVILATPEMLNMYMWVDFPEPFGRRKINMNAKVGGEKNQAKVTLVWPEDLVTIS